MMAFCLHDQKGPVTYVRLDVDGDYIRIHTQFAPEAVVSKRRLVVAMIEAVRTLVVAYRESAKGFIFNSVNPSLIAFMDKHLNFRSCGNSDYVLKFDQETAHEEISKTP